VEIGSVTYQIEFFLCTVIMLLADVFVILLVRFCETHNKILVCKVCENLFVDFCEMFFIVLGSVALATFIWFLSKKDPEPVLGVYSQPGIIGIGVFFITQHYAAKMVYYTLIPCLFGCSSIHDMMCRNTCHRLISLCIPEKTQERYLFINGKLSGSHV